MWNLSLYLEHLYSRDNSIQGIQNFVPEKCSNNLCTRYLRLKGHLGTLFFWVRKPGLTSPPGTHSKKRLTTKSADNFKFTLLTRATAFTRRTISLKLMYFTCGNATHNNAARDKVNLDFLHIIYLLEIITAADPETK